MVPEGRRPRGHSPFSGALDDEPARLEHTRRLSLTGGRSPALDRLTDLAAHLTGCSAAQVSLVEEEQVVVGWTGPETSWSTVGIPADDSVCALTVAGAAPVLIDDARTDPRVRDLPPVRSGEIGSYLGVPLVSQGLVVGALCVVEGVPRTWSAADVAIVEALAGPVVAELELAALEADYETERLLWEVAVDAAGVGVWDWDLRTGEVRWDDRMLEMFGLTRAGFAGTIDSFGSAVHAADRDRVERALAHAVEICGAYHAEYRVPCADGSTRWVSARGRALPGVDGTAVRVLGAAFDTTAVRDSEARVARVLDAMPSGFCHVDTSWRFTIANPEARRLLGDVGADVIGDLFWDHFPSALGTELEATCRRAMQTGEPTSFEGWYPAPIGRWFEIRAWPTPDGLSIYFIDVTERRRVRDEMERVARRDAMLADVTRSLTETLETGEAASRLAQIVVSQLADWCIVSQVDQGRSGVLGHRVDDIGWAHGDAASQPTLDRLASIRIGALSVDSAVARALDTAAPVLTHDPDHAVSFRTGEAADLCAALAPTSTVVLPLRGRARTVGLITVCRGAGRPPFTDVDLVTLADLAGRAGPVLENLRAYDEQRDLAEGLQRSLLTAPPQLDGLEVAVRYEPAAQAAQVGGDWYDVFVVPDGPPVLVIGDVVGHDTAAAAAMGQIRSLVRGIAVTAGAEPAALLAAVDGAMRALRLETTATALIANVDQGRFCWSNAGHPPPVLAVPSPDGPVAVTELWAARSDLLLGLDPATRRGETGVDLPVGATLLLYTDGLVERRGEAIDAGIARLGGVLGELVADGVGLEELCDAVLGRMLPQRPDDDVALIAVRRH